MASDNSERIKQREDLLRQKQQAEELKRLEKEQRRQNKITQKNKIEEAKKNKLQQKVERRQQIKQQNRPTPFLWGVACVIAMGFGAGKMLKAPGTHGSFVGALLAAFIAYHTNSPFFLFATLLLFFIGWWVTSYYVRILNRDDPQEIVIDEIVGQWFTLVVIPFDPAFWVLGFLLFRFFDILKPFPIRWLDRNIVGGFGVMVDDVMAGIYAGGVLGFIYYSPLIFKYKAIWDISNPWTFNF